MARAMGARANAWNNGIYGVQPKLARRRWAVLVLAFVTASVMLNFHFVRTMYLLQDGTQACLDNSCLKFGSLAKTLTDELGRVSPQGLDHLTETEAYKELVAALEGRSSPEVNESMPRLICNPGMTQIPFHMKARVTKPLPKSKIPRQIFFSGATRLVAKPICDNLAHLQAQNPEYDIYFFDDNDIDTFLWRSEFAPIRPLYNMIATGAIKSDIWRYLVMLKFGGVYSDLDSEWHGHFRDFIPRDIEIVSAGMQDGAISQWFMVFVPGYQIMSKAADFALRRVLGILCGGPEAKWEFKDKKYISGPPLLQDAFLGSLPLISADAIFSIKDRMHYYVGAHFNDFASHNYDPVKDVSKKQSVPWESEDVSVIRTDVNRAAFTPKVCTEWGRIIGETFRRYTQLHRAVLEFRSGRMGRDRKLRSRLRRSSADDFAEEVQAAGSEETAEVVAEPLKPKSGKERRLSRRRSSRKSGKRMSLQATATALLKGDVEDVLPDTPDSANWSAGKRGAYLALVMHGVTIATVIGLLGGINLLSIVFLEHKFPWALYPAVILISLFFMHFGFTWGIMRALGASTKELDEIVERVVYGVVDLVVSFSKLYADSFNPFPKGSRLAKVFDFLLDAADDGDD
ncbi:Initiation-specific alpha-1,6-mannosyltransferase [Hondaea fermentalgiana]|uniref:Initiation-specific alpha-1,6-mannosyltransferase n=1 Tax=Hondaea fermentalgiana TaxID=2315210 RepID=A0A2R5GFQ3_9STRA|nr:Initiation-specific alpha-1,6-mannosyltransferase [Hondaea fermentalgiana]|eukprot:GBG29746.1 Initiation-specific alpha-1,6-mannosyltransferase [Hondaea fermentalgiana]